MNELEFLRDEAARARARLLVSRGAILSHLKTLADPRAWVAEKPGATLGVVAGLGLAGGIAAALAAQGRPAPQRGTDPSRPDPAACLDSKDANVSRDSRNGAAPGRPSLLHRALMGLFKQGVKHLPTLIAPLTSQAGHAPPGAEESPSAARSFNRSAVERKKPPLRPPAEPVDRLRDQLPARVTLAPDGH